MSDSDDSDFDIGHKKKKSRHYEEEVNEEDSEEDEEEEERHEARSSKTKKRKKKHFDIHQMFDEEAEVDDDDEDEEYDDEADDLEQQHGGRYSERDALQEANAGVIARKYDSMQRMREFMDQNPEDIERYYADKYREQESYSNRFGEGEAMADSIIQQSHLPGIKDPNLWAIRCRIGEEKSTVLALMRKFLAMQNSENPLQIKSAFSKEGLKGLIYVEAFSPNHVRDAIDGINALSLAKFKQVLVPNNEMTDVLKVVKEFGKLKPGQWVRVKSGLYRDDLALVDHVEDAQTMVALKLVPRIDYERYKPDYKQSDERRFKRPPAQLLDRSKVKDRLHSEGSYVVLSGNRFDSDGFLRKDFRLNAIITGGIRPSLQELERFGQASDGNQLALVASMVNKKAASVMTAEPNSGKKAQNAAGALIISHTFAPGDVVEVCDGDLQNLRGKVISVDGDTRIVVQPNHSDLKDPIPFAPSELTKFFSQGDHVKVLSGPFEGETGLVLRFEPTLAIVLSDHSMTEMKVAPKSLRLWQDHATNTNSNSNVQLMDLVKVDPQTVGVIVGVERDRVSVLTMFNKLISLKANTALKRLNNDPQRAGKALDKNGNLIQSKDSVTFTEKPHLGMGGEVKHIYRSWAFVYCRTHLENSGILVVKARQLTLVGAPTVTAQTKPTRGVSGPQQARNGSAPRYKAVIDKKLFGKTARIVAGTLKGHTGIICDATVTEVLLELHSQFRKVHVLRDNIALLDSSGRIVSSTQYGSSTTPRSTSVHVPQTPMHGSQTPHAASMTPRPDATPLSNYFLPGMATPALKPDDPMTPSSSYAWQTPNDYNRSNLSDNE
ncbi:Transcription elongation factor SPT5 [Cichlidogyrus casuarinus]|uniref:Transcription elongation factor SPT5 n=1 Tax=Cichlidogyrus casuarinus TaxID=1844966 RepID=A0ABD2QG82_9PLAT